MKEFLSNLFIAVLAVTVPVIAAHGIKLIKEVAERAVANTDDIKKKGYIKEITDAVAATSQTFVDALKRTGNFTQERWGEAADKALDACLAAISPATKAFVEATYGDITTYLKPKIEAEVCKQKNETPKELSVLGEWPMKQEATTEQTED